MNRVFTLTLLLFAGLILSQNIPLLTEHYKVASHAIKVGTMISLSFIMIHVGYEFEIKKIKSGNMGMIIWLHLPRPHFHGSLSHFILYMW
jgi:hypothetical protein